MDETFALYNNVCGCCSIEVRYTGNYVDQGYS